MRRFLNSALLVVGLYALAPAAMLAFSARQAAAECYYAFGCGGGWGWGLLGAIAYDDMYDSDPWYDDGHFGAGETAVAIALIDLIARSSQGNTYYDDGYYDDGYYDTGYYDPNTAYSDTVYQGAPQRGDTYYETGGTKAFVAPQTVTAAPQQVAVAAQPRTQAAPEGRYVSQGQLASCDRYVIDHREYRLCGGTWYARQFLMNWGQVAQPPGVVMQ